MSAMDTELGPRIRVLVAKPGLDGHDRGAKVVARGLRDAGMEVIYTGLHRTPAQIVRAAVDEDVHVVGLSVLSGAHNRLLPEVVSGLRTEGREDVLVIAGGIIPDADAAALRERGVAAVFPPGTAMETIVNFVKSNVMPRW
jgi:methylmalonyl-CoA mutase C-terminal domain/subunit